MVGNQLRKIYGGDDVEHLNMPRVFSWHPTKSRQVGVELYSVCHEFSRGIQRNPAQAGIPSNISKLLKRILTHLERREDFQIKYLNAFLKRSPCERMFARSSATHAPNKNGRYQAARTSIKVRALTLAILLCRKITLALVPATFFLVGKKMAETMGNHPLNCYLIVFKGVM